MTSAARLARLVAVNAAIAVAAVAAYGILRKLRLDTPVPLIAGDVVAFITSLYLMRHGATGSYAAPAAIAGAICAAVLVHFASLKAMLDLWGL